MKWSELRRQFFGRRMRLANIRRVLPLGVRNVTTRGQVKRLITRWQQAAQQPNQRKQAEAASPHDPIGMSHRCILPQTERAAAGENDYVGVVVENQFATIGARQLIGYFRVLGPQIVDAPEIAADAKILAIAFAAQSLRQIGVGDANLDEDGILGPNRSRVALADCSWSSGGNATAAAFGLGECGRDVVERHLQHLLASRALGEHKLMVQAEEPRPLRVARGVESSGRHDFDDPRSRPCEHQVGQARPVRGDDDFRLANQPGLFGQRVIFHRVGFKPMARSKCSS